jgi:hypothetical protein
MASDNTGTVATALACLFNTGFSIMGVSACYEVERFLPLKSNDHLKMGSIILELPNDYHGKLGQTFRIYSLTYF